MLLPGKLHHNPLLTFTPGPKGPGVFFFCSFIPADPAIAGCRLTTGYLAVRISDPVARPSGPLNSQPRRLCRRAQLAAAFARQARSSSGGERYAHSQHGCEVSRHPFDSGKDRPAWLGWTPGPIQKYLSAAPVDVSTANISFRVLAFEAVARIGRVCIAVLSVSGSLELRRRRIKSAKKL